MAGIKQILFCHKKHKFQEKNAGAKLVLVSVFWFAAIPSELALMI